MRNIEKSSVLKSSNFKMNYANIEWIPFISVGLGNKNLDLSVTIGNKPHRAV